MKIKYDTRTKGTRLQTLHREVRQGIKLSQLLSKQLPLLQQHQLLLILIPLGMNEVASIGYDLSSLSFNNTIKPNNTSNIPSSSPVLSQAQPSSLSLPLPSSLSSSSSSIPQSNNDNDINRIAHLILVDQKLNNTNTSNTTTGVDIIVSTVSQSILADSYTLKMNTAPHTTTTTTNNITTPNNATTDKK